MSAPCLTRSAMPGKSPRIVARCRGVSPRSLRLLTLFFRPLLLGVRFREVDGGGVQGSRPEQ